MQIIQSTKRNPIRSQTPRLHRATQSSHVQISSWFTQSYLIVTDLHNHICKRSVFLLRHHYCAGVFRTARPHVFFSTILRPVVLQLHSPLTGAFLVFENRVFLTISVQFSSSHHISVFFWERMFASFGGHPIAPSRLLYAPMPQCKFIALFFTCFSLDIEDILAFHFSHIAKTHLRPP